MPSGNKPLSSPMLKQIRVVTQRSVPSVAQKHYNDVIMSAMTSQITDFSIVCPTGGSGADQRNISKFRVTGLCAGNEFPTQKASNVKNVSIWWRHHEVSRYGRIISSRVIWKNGYSWNAILTNIINQLKHAIWCTQLWHQNIPTRQYLSRINRIILHIELYIV